MLCKATKRDFLSVMLANVHVFVHFFILWLYAPNAYAYMVAEHKYFVYSFDTFMVPMVKADPQP